MAELQPTDEDPVQLFEEYVQRIEDEPELPVEPLLARAGARRSELLDLLDLHRAMEGVRSGTTGAGLPDDLGLLDDLGVQGSGRSPLLGDGRENLGRFERLKLIGEGGLSRVYLAYDSHMRRPVALKVLSTPHVDAAGAREWMLNEGRSIARLEHPGVVRVFEVAEIEGVACIAMEHVRGPSLREVLYCLREQAGQPEKDAPPLTPEARAAAARLSSVAARCELVAELAEALAYCHANGVIHRDIKPANVLLADGRAPRLIDFGLAHLESTEATGTEITQKLVGTPAYIAPEQVDGNRTGASEHSDQFALGVLLVELISLRNPFRRDTRTETLDAISRADPPQPRELDPTISEDLERICVHALERDPQRRYASVAAFAADLRAFLEHRAISLRAPTPAMLLGLWARRNRRRLRLSAATVALGVLAVIGLRVSELRSARGALVVRVAELQASLPQRRNPGDFSTTYLDLANLRHQAEALDGSLLTGLLFQPMLPVVSATIHACSRRVSELYAERQAPADTSESGPEAENHATELLQQWAAVLKQDSVVCPECTYNRAASLLGTVSLPTSSDTQSVTLFRHGAKPRFPIATTLERVAEPTDLTPAFYRLLVRDLSLPGSSRVTSATDVHALDGTREMEFALRFAAPHWAPEPNAMPDFVRDSLMPCAGGTITLSDDPASKGAATVDADVKPFFIARRPITWIDIGTVWGEERRDDYFHAYLDFIQTTSPSFSKQLKLEDPAILTWRLAADFATDCGARLPTVMEWRAVFRTPGFEIPPDLSVAVGEWTSVTPQAVQNMRCRILYRNQANDAWNTWTTQTVDSGTSPGTAFRLARSSP